MSHIMTLSYDVAFFLDILSISSCKYLLKNRRIFFKLSLARKNVKIQRFQPFQSNSLKIKDLPRFCSKTAVLRVQTGLVTLQRRLR